MTQESLLVEQLQQHRNHKTDNGVKARAEEVSDRMGQAETLLSDAAAALRDFASSRSGQAERDSCLGALKKIDMATDLFQAASTCATSDWNAL